MSLVVTLGSLALLLLLSAAFSGSETGIYSISRVQLDVEAEHRRWTAGLVRRLLRDDSGMLVALLIGNNLMLELLTHHFEGALPAGLPAQAREVTVALILTPLVFLFGELLPKDQFRRRPLRLLALAAPLLYLSRLVFLPLSLPIQGLSRLLERRFGVERQRLAGALRREEMLEVLEAGMRSGVLTPHAEALARNVLVLRETPLSQVMVPWERVSTLDLTEPEEAIRRFAERSEFSRLPVLRPDRPESSANGSGRKGPPGRVVAGYLHLLDLMGEGLAPADCLRELPALGADEPVDRALAKLRLSGQRLALVGTPEAPEGLVTLTDVVGAISKQSRAL